MYNSNTMYSCSMVIRGVMRGSEITSNVKEAWRHRVLCADWRPMLVKLHEFLKLA